MNRHDIDIKTDEYLQVPIEWDHKGAYSICNRDLITNRVNSDILHAQEILSKKLTMGKTINQGECRFLLQQFKWDKKKLFNHARPITVDKLRKKAGFKDCPVEKEAVSGEDCPICCEEGRRLIGLACQHRVCGTCWKEYLLERFKMGIEKIDCMDVNCNLVVSDEKIVQFLRIAHRTPFKEFQDWKFYLYLDTQPIKKCKGANCERYFRLCDRRIRKIICECTKITYTNRCCNEWHTPVPCALWQMWKRHPPPTPEIPRPAPLVTGLGVYYKRCPRWRCRVLIERTGGCLLMTCGGCGFHFCWLCQKSWDGNHERNNPFVCRNVRIPRPQTVTRVNRLFRDDFFRITHERCREYMNPAFIEPAKAMCHKNMQILKRLDKYGQFKQSDFLQKAYHYLLSWRQLIVSLNIFRFFVKYKSDSDMIQFVQRLDKFTEDWNQFSKFMHTDLSEPYFEYRPRIDRWMEKIEASADRLTMDHKAILGPINEHTEDAIKRNKISYYFLIPF